MNKQLQSCLTTLAFVLSGTAFAQSNLPACQGSYTNWWSNCIGTATFANGGKYVGEWKDGKQHGKGTTAFEGGDKYEGESKDGKRNGQGTFFRADGRIALGEWAADMPSGRFIEYRADKSVERSGIFKNGTLVTSQYIDPNSFTRITRNNSAPAVSDSQRQEADQLKAQLEEERRLRRLEEVKRKEAEEKSSQAQEANQVKPNIASNVGTDKRIALVIGNAKYQSSPLRNPINDANDISNALKQSGFEVIDLQDANLQQMISAVRSFGDRLLNSDVGLVYYSGHGIESKGRNYFIPVNTDIQRDDEISYQALDVSLILDKMTTAGKGVNILIVDACRNDPFTRSFRTTSKGLAAMDAPKGTISKMTPRTIKRLGKTQV